MKPLSVLTSLPLILARENIDTDQIVPARFLSVTTFDGLASAAFADWRFDAEGQERADCVLNEPAHRHRSILVAGRNFGCGSSREHAPRALLEFGIRVVISTQIADIFRGNALNCGLLAIEVPDAEHQWLVNHPEGPVTVDLQQCHVELAGGHRQRFEVDAFSRECLLQGRDRLGFLLAQAPHIAQFERTHP